jgi:hypothetical protein
MLGLYNSMVEISDSVNINDLREAHQSVDEMHSFERYFLLVVNLVDEVFNELLTEHNQRCFQFEGCLLVELLEVLQYDPSIIGVLVLQQTHKHFFQLTYCEELVG